MIACAGEPGGSRLDSPAVASSAREASELIDIAARGVSPGPLLSYAAAAVQQGGLLGIVPGVKSARALSLMMSWQAARLALSVHGRSPVEKAASLASLMRPGAGESRAGALAPLLAQLSPGKPAVPGSPAWGRDVAVAWLAVLRLAGIGASDVMTLQFRDTDRVAMVIGGVPALAEGAVLERWYPRKLHLERQVLGAFNDAVEVGPDGHVTGDPDVWDALFARLRREFPAFDVRGLMPSRRALHPSEPAPPDPVPAKAPPEAGDFAAHWAHGGAPAAGPGELAYRVRRHVFLRSVFAGDALCTLARYAHQTLYVDRPEAYALAGVITPDAGRLAARLATPPAMVEWIRSRVRPGSIFPEPDRVMLAGQVIANRVGRALDQAMLLYALLTTRGFRARVIQTTRGTYTYFKDEHGLTLIDVERMRAVDSVDGVVTLALDATRQYGLKEALSAPLDVDLAPFAA